MTNGDVVKMAKMGFGNDLIEAKITQAPGVDFKLDIDDLSKLKAAGVPQDVISAMLKRSTASTAPAAAGAPGRRSTAIGADSMPLAADADKRLAPGGVRAVELGGADV